jgi:hypothetical protein
MIGRGCVIGLSVIELENFGISALVPRSKLDEASSFQTPVRIPPTAD